MQDNILPLLSQLLHDRYREQRRAWCAEVGFAWPERRSRKRKPFPGVLDVADDSEG